MSVLSACQSAMVRLVGRKPQTVFSSTNQMEIEIADLATDVAVDIMKSHDWRALTKFHTLTGDGSTTEFDLPSDFDRIVLAQRITDTSNWLWGYSSAQTLEDWMVITNSGFAAVTPGWWVILDGKMQFSPAPTSGSPAKFAYISKNIARAAAGGAPIATFTDDGDSFVLEDRLLTLGLIWRWKAQKGLEYAEDMANFEKAFSENAGRDKGSQAIRKGSPYSYLGTHLAWPWPLG
jgi:hypothetical protein